MAIGTWEDFTDKYGFSDIEGVEQRDFEARARLVEMLNDHEAMNAAQGEIEIGLPVVTIAELAHGAYRTKTQAQQQRRLEFIERLSSDLPAHPVTLDIARLWSGREGIFPTMFASFAIARD
jgi:hypothetical protein